ncbi:MAG: radical SAM protein [Leptospiraceae bacterium]|nr:MAG: radical SAM protein [Leptospiraceae bacterium]
MPFFKTSFDNIISSISFKPAYLNLYQNHFKEFQNRIQIAEEMLKNCNVCPQECHVDRNEELGYCRIGKKVKVSSYFAHFGEEDILRGWNGSGTIFFNLCNLRCVFCQNFEISQLDDPEAIELEPVQLADVMINLQNQGVHNINFVSPDHVIPQILFAIYEAIPKGLSLPLVYNSNAFSSIDSLKLLEGIIDIYMPDFKFWDPSLARRYLKTEDYPEIAKKAILEMYHQVGDIKFDEFGLAKKGLIVRHLVMPGYVEDSKKILYFLSKISKKIYINIMSQYRPYAKVLKRPDIYKEINRPITKEEYREVVQFAYDLGFEYIDHDN